MNKSFGFLFIPGLVKPRFLEKVFGFLDFFLGFKVFTALHGMQTRSSDGNSVCPSVRLTVCPSVCPSNAWIVTKRKKAVFRFLYHTKEHLS